MTLFIYIYMIQEKLEEKCPEKQGGLILESL